MRGSRADESERFQAIDDVAVFQIDPEPRRSDTSSPSSVFGVRRKRAEVRVVKHIDEIEKLEDVGAAARSTKRPPGRLYYSQRTTNPDRLGKRRCGHNPLFLSYRPMLR